MPSSRLLLGLLLSLLLGLIIAIQAAQSNPANDKRVAIHESTLNGKVRNFIWLDERTALVRTSKSLYLTTNAGKTWAKQDGHLCGKEQCASKIVVSPVGKRTVFIHGTSNNNWVTRDPGSGKYEKVQFVINDKPASVQSFHFHPTQRERALALVKATPEDTTYTLFETRDLGKTWIKVATDIRSANWGSPHMPYYSSDTAYAILHSKTSLLNPTTKRAFVAVNLRTTAIQELVPDGRAFSTSKDYIFVATSSASEEASLFISDDNAQTFRKIKISNGNTKQAKFTILDSAAGSVFINVFHSEFDTEPWGTVFRSDATGARFSVALPHNRRSGPSCDFHKIKSMEGVYIANIVTSTDEEECRRCNEYLRCSALCTHATRITYDRGGNWELLRAPKTDSNNKPVTCSEDARIEGTDHCQLNLQGLASRTDMPVHAHESAIGVIISAGNTGSDLEGPMSEKTNIYLSRDGGRTWEEIIKGPHYYEMSDSGSLLVVTPANKVADHFSYSLNQGQTWTKVNLTNPVPIRKIHIPHNIPGVKTMVLEGEVDDNSVLYFTDFSQAHQRVCSGMDNPGTEKSDYEYFTPEVYKSNKCFMGRRVDYVRRKRSSLCFNPEGAIPRHRSENCECTYADYECDYGYEVAEKKENGEFVCKPEKGFTPSSSPPRNCFTFYNVTRGYIRTAGNTCEGGVNLDPIRKACPTGLGLLSVVLLTLLFVILCGLVAYIVRKNAKTLRDAFRGSEQYTPLDMNDEFDLDDDEDESASEIDESMLRSTDNDNIRFNDENVRRKGRDQEDATQFSSAPEVDSSIFESDGPTLESITVEGEESVPGTSLNPNEGDTVQGFNPRGFKS